MDYSKQTSNFVNRDGMLNGVFESNTGTVSERPTVVRGFLGTVSKSGTVVEDVDIEEINKSKPWRQVIKRRFINGGSDYENI